MRSDEFISTLSKLTEGDDEGFEAMRKRIPLGVDASGEVLYACKREKAFPGAHTCVTGGGKGGFIRRLLITVSCLFDSSEICFFVLSPAVEYGELLRMKSMDVTVPYIDSKADLERAVATLKELLRLRETGKGYPRLFVVLDGLENLEGCNRNEDLEEYREIIELLARREGVDVVTGVELTRSIFGGYPGAFVGVGHCLVAIRESGKADVTYVREDASLTMPQPITYPDTPSLVETVLFFNSVSRNQL